jgi:hypothetical protein
VSKVSIELDEWDVSTVVDVIAHLAALMDPDDPDGLRDASGRRSKELEQHLLTDAQLRLLRHPAYRDDDRLNVAKQLRRIAADIDGQLPPTAPQTWTSRPL